MGDSFCLPHPVAVSDFSMVTVIFIIIIIFIYIPISTVHSGTSSVDYITKCIYNN